MDKRKVLLAYRRGMLTIQECAQIIGVDSLKVVGIVNETKPLDKRRYPKRANG